MVQKFPPPPPMPLIFGSFGQQLNRWLLELQSILNSQGTINPGNVDGLTALIAQVATLVAEIATLTAEVVANTANIATNTANIATNTTAIAANAAAITALQANPIIRNGAGAPGAGLGNNGDLYINNTGGAGTHLYGKIAGAWVAFA
jgi:ABC-type transporter Mla subunit MlaD